MWTMALVLKMTAPPEYNPTITSGVDGNHKIGSKHYSGDALDWRTFDYPGSVPVWVKRIQQKLGGDFDVVIESDHIHIEYDPD